MKRLYESAVDLGLQRTLRLALLLAAVAGLDGCVTQDPYPDYWPALAAVPASDCPDLAGRYYVEAVESGTCYAGEGRAYKADWRCQLELDWAIGVDGVARSDGWIELSQPDAGQLVVTTESGTRVLRSSAGEFRCEQGVLEISEHASALSEEGQGKATNAMMGTGVALMSASGGVNTLSRRFRRAADGSLVAELYESSTGLMLLVPFHISERHYLRWPAWEEPAPAVGEPGTGQADDAAEPAG
jgi:hypothetical protein